MKKLLTWGLVVAMLMLVAIPAVGVLDTSTAYDEPIGIEQINAELSADEVEAENEEDAPQAVSGTLAGHTPTGIPLSEIGYRIEELVEQYMDEFTPGLAVAIVYDGEIVFSQGYGHTDLSRQTPVDSAVTVFEHGSINKLFIWTSVMQLVERGLIDLDNDVSEYLPADIMREFNFRYSFTVRQLLNHSAGFGEYAFDLWRNADLTDRPMYTLREGLLLGQAPQIYVPGTAASYSNFGSALMAYIVVNVSGMEFANYERANIFAPLGMTNTRNQPHWLGDSAFIANKARGHVPARDGLAEATWGYVPMYPAGASRGTAEDLAQFAIALMPAPGEQSPLFDDRATLDIMLSPTTGHPEIAWAVSHGFLTYDGVLPGIGHGGGTMGFNTDFIMIPEERFAVVAFSNANGGAMFIGKVMDLILGNSRDAVPPSPAGLPDARNLAGEFVALRRTHGDALESMNALILGTNMMITAVDENTIEVVAQGQTLTYRQVAPYAFRVVGAEGAMAAFMARMVYELYFVMEDGQPVRLLTPNGFDATRATFGQSMVGSLLYMAVWYIIILFFIVMSIILLIRAIRRKRVPNAFTRLHAGLILCGLAFALNDIAFFVRLLGVMPFLNASLATQHIWVNWIILVASAVLFVLSLVAMKKCEVSTKSKVFHFIVAALLAVLVALMWSGNVL
ncbi:MAG: beta-lactamase family protein [Oscillospiraceae bacterium]|nr:beta-lactamase family protein [Oscillospiraceae bacterium]